MADLHPDFRAAAPAMRWNGPLHLLRGALDIEADKKWRSPITRGSWAFRVLPHGACVGALRLEHARQIRISRSTRPHPRDLPKWERELATFCEKLNIVGWEPVADPAARGIAQIYRCAITLICKCGSRMDDNASLFGRDLCSACELRRRREGVA